MANVNYPQDRTVKAGSDADINCHLSMLDKNTDIILWYHTSRRHKL